MGLEAGNYIDNLVATNPLGTDAKSAGDDHLRLIKNALKNCFAGFTGAVVVTGTDGGAVNAYTLTTTPALIGYTTRMIALFSPTIANTGAATINISGLGTRPIVSVSNAALVAGDLAPGTIYSAAYDGTSFRLLSITKNYADQLSFSGALPAQAGNADKFITTNGTVASWSDLIKVGTMKFADSADTTKRVQFDLSGVTAGQTRTMKWQDRNGYVGGMDRSSRTSNSILTTADHNNDIVVTGAGAFTQTLTAAATLGAGWRCRYWNATTGNITFDPNASELIDGAITGILEPGMGIEILCDGSQFSCDRIGPSVTKLLTSGTSGTWPLGVRRASWEQVGGGGSGARGNSAGHGAGAGYLRKKLTNVSPNTGYTYAIGAPGASQTSDNTAGISGSATTLTYNAVTYTANGGQGGQLGLGATGGTATNGDINISGGNTYAVSTGTSATAGGTPLSPTTTALTSQAQTIAGLGLGGGGISSGNGTASGAGAPGGIILEY